jgi:serine phosphatase RsbU (regulator of sigma subunit)/Flp pilus assembly protein TadD
MSFINIKRVLFFLSLFIFTVKHIRSANQDSLLKKLSNTNNDKDKAELYLKIGRTYLNNDMPKAFDYFDKAKKISQKNNYSTQYISSLNNLAVYYRLIDDYTESKKLFKNSLELATKEGDKYLLAGIYEDYANMYKHVGIYDTALILLRKALDVNEQLKDTKSTISCLTNLGSIYSESEDYTNAEIYYKKSYTLSRSINDPGLSGATLIGLGIVFGSKGEFEKARENFNEAFTYFKKVNDISMMATCLSNISTVNLLLKDYKKAFDAGLLAIDIKANSGNKKDLSTAYCNMAEIYIEAGETKKATDCVEKGLSIAKEIDNKDALKFGYDVGALIYSKLKNYEKALDYKSKYISLFKKIYSEQKSKQIQELEAKYQNQSKQKEIEVQEVKLKNQDIVILQQKRINISIIISLIIISSLAVFAAINYRQKKRSNVILSVQKTIIEEKQKEIIDSINYAKRIQATLLANEDFVNNNLNENFILFKPKDIVSGDFYWAAQKGDNFYIAVCDCTGHGVPGAFMSLLNISFLNEAIIEKNILEPNNVLDHVRKRLIENLSQQGGQDGMDAILICINKKNNLITYAAANNEPVLIRNNEIIELPKDKMPVGKGEKTDNFTLHTIKHQKNDVLYLYTDGFADQFGGPNGKKFKYKKLNDLLLSVSTENLKNQKEILNGHFENWKGDLEQVDDICIIGIKI